MEVSVSSVISFVTLFMGYISKKFTLIDKKYIPIQNLFIGLLSGLLIYFISLNNNLFNSVIIAVISSMSAGGIYDALPRGGNYEKQS